MDLIYYYPTSSGSPANVSRSILKTLIKHKDNVPFNKIKLFCKKKDVSRLKEEFKGLDILTYTDLHKVTKNDIVHFPMLPLVLPNSKFFLYLYSTFLKERKTLIQYHGDLRTELETSGKKIPYLSLPSYFYTPYILNTASRVITHSIHMRSVVESYGVKEVAVIPNAIEEYWLEPQQAEKTKVEKCLGETRVFYHGRLSWEKGVDILVEALSQFVEKEPQAILYIAGDGPQKEYLQKLSLKCSISKNVVFIGNIDRDAIKFYLKNVDVAIYPSRFDNFPLSVLEALACAECPVYFSKNTGVYDFAIKDNYKLNFFEPEVENVLNILKSYSTVTKGNCVNIQKKMTEKYHWDSVINDYINLYIEILKN